MGKDKKNNVTHKPLDDHASGKADQSNPKSIGLFEDSKHPGSFYFMCAVKPNARDDHIDLEGDQWILSICSPPVKGKANADIIKYLSHKIGVAKSQIQLIKGETSHMKTFYISTNGLTLSDLKRCLIN